MRRVPYTTHAIVSIEVERKSRSNVLNDVELKKKKLHIAVYLLYVKDMYLFLLDIRLSKIECIECRTVSEKCAPLTTTWGQRNNGKQRLKRKKTERERERERSQTYRPTTHATRSYHINGQKTHPAQPQPCGTAPKSSPA